MRNLVFAITFATMLAAPISAQTTDPNKLKDQITGDAKISPSANPQCKLFTQAEIAGYAGAEVGPGQNSAGGAGCNWHNKTYSASVTVSVVPPNYFPEPTAVKGFKRLPNVGSKGWVAPDSGWSAGTMLKDAAIVVVISGNAATEASAIALLQETLKRRK
ncbi:MAG TPA: hypothetical protein VK629_04975 [Steroidobacteraceae bacterium]|nr:hypothetical protein [Steroidobacteraceae bacterium]